MKFFKALWDRFNNCLSFFAPVVDLFVRYWVGQAFFYSGLTKLQPWSSTMYLFTHEYKVPFLSPYWAAVSGTAGEIVLSVLLIVGLFGRIPAVGLFIANFVAVWSYPYLWTAAGQVGFNQHVVWGVFLLVLMTHGNGAISLDNLIKKVYHTMIR